MTFVRHFSRLQRPETGRLWSWTGSRSSGTGARLVVFCREKSHQLFGWKTCAPYVRKASCATIVQSRWSCVRRGNFMGLTKAEQQGWHGVLVMVWLTLVANNNNNIMVYYNDELDPMNSDWLQRNYQLNQAIEDIRWKLQGYISRI